MTRVNFSIIGCGGAAVPVGEAISTSPLAALAAVYDVDLSLARDFGESYRVPFTGDVEVLLGDPSVQAVYIGVPHDLLAPLARRALEAGKHVLVEKPMALTLADADALIARAEARRLALGVFYEMRYAAPFVQARELIRAGALGRIIGVRIQTLIDKSESYWRSGLSGRSANPWRGQKARAGGGVVLMNTSHQLDAIHYITGLEVVSVSAEVGTLTAPVEVEDIAAATLRFSNGAVGSLFAGAHLAGARVGSEHFDLFGTHGQLRVPDAYGDGGLQVYLRQAWGDIPANVWHTVPGSEAQVYAEAVEAFARAVQRGEPAPTNGHDARRVLATVLAIYQAAAEKRTLSIPIHEVNYA
jgi:predicted dehydrogenase